MSIVEAGSPFTIHRRTGLAEVAGGVDKVARGACEGMSRTLTGDPEVLHSIAWSAGIICIQVVTGSAVSMVSAVLTVDRVAVGSIASRTCVICIQVVSIGTSQSNTCTGASKPA